MPMDRSKYPADWDAIARKVKERAGWRCERCGTPHGTDLGRRILTVHHKDHNPANCATENLIALCDACHLREERKWRRSAKGRQQQLFGGRNV